MARRSQGLFSCCTPFSRRYFLLRQSAVGVLRDDPRHDRNEVGVQKEKRRCRSPFARKRNTGKSSHAPTLSLYHKKMLLVNTLSEGFRNFSLLHKNVLKASAKMSIEKCENICYNEITKQEEVQSDETLISTTFIHKISSFVHNDSGTDTHHSSYREIF